MDDFWFNVTCDSLKEEKKRISPVQHPTKILNGEVASLVSSLDSKTHKIRDFDSTKA